MYTWEKFWDIWDSVVLSNGRVYGAIDRKIETFIQRMKLVSVIHILFLKKSM